MGWEQFAIYLTRMFQDMRHFTLLRGSLNGRLRSWIVRSSRRYGFDPPKKSYHGGVDPDRYLEGHSLTKYGKELDSRRQNLYDAQNVAKESISIDSFESLKDTAQFVGDILRRAWWQRRYRLNMITLKPGYGAKRATAQSPRTLTFPEHARTEWSVLHELIHLTIPRPHAGHGRLYCARFLEIVGWHFGDEAEQTLKSAYREQNVKWHPRQAPSDVNGTDLVHEFYAE